MDPHLTNFLTPAICMFQPPDLGLEDKIMGSTRPQPNPGTIPLETQIFANPFLHSNQESGQLMQPTVFTFQRDGSRNMI